MKRRILILCVSCLMLIPAVVAFVLFLRPGSSSPPNVIMIIVDTLRADRLGCYGCQKDTSPAIDRLAKESVLCEKVFAQRGITWPSVTSIMTSQYPAQHRVRENGEAMSEHLLTLACVLGEHGYRTAAFLGNMTTALHPGIQERITAEESSRNIDRDTFITQKAIEWLGKRKEERFFAWLHYMAPHKPYEPPDEYIKKLDPDYQGNMDYRPEALDRITLEKLDAPPRDIEHLNAVYNACVRFSDDRIGDLLAAVDELGLKKKTIVVLMADHGEELYDRNHYFYHGCSMYDAVLHVPAILRWPGRIAPARFGDVMESIDIAPTILDLASVPIPTTFKGRSVAQWIRKGLATSGDADGKAFSEWQDKMSTVRTDRWRYVWNPQEIKPIGDPYSYIKNETDQRRYGYIIPKEGLYDRVAEPTECKDLAVENPDEARSLQRYLAQWQARLPWEYVKSPISDESQKEIKTNGYTK